jgi:PadR family transcriptional regulator PadR
MPRKEMAVLQGTLDLLVLRALSWGPMHGYAVITWLRQRTDEELLVEDTAVYPALHRLESRGLIESEWGLSENNRRAKFYRITATGRTELRAVTDDWTRYVGVMAKVLRLTD